MKFFKHRRTFAIIASTIAVLGLLGGAAGLAVLYGGWYNVGATRQHWQPVYSLLETGMRRSVEHHTRDIVVPPLGDTALVSQGARVFEGRCRQCHGAPGVAQDDFGKSMQPVPGPLVDAARRWRPAELYWITRHGIKLSGMPAWEYHLSDREIWAVVGFMQVLPRLSAQGYAQMTAAAADPSASQQRTAGGPPARIGDAVARGRLALAQYACQACHQIPGVTGSEVWVGPPLAGYARRGFIAGRLPNTADNLVLWIRDPQRVRPGTAMPNQGVTEGDARDMAAYLQTLTKY